MYQHTNSENTFILPHGQSWWHFHTREPANVRGTESTLNSALIIRPIKPVRHRCLTEFIGNSLEVEVWLADMCDAKLSATTEWQVRCKSGVYKNLTSLFTNLCENRDILMKNKVMLMKNPKSISGLLQPISKFFFQI